MKKNWCQRFVESYVPWIFAGLLFVGSVLDALSNAVKWITPPITYTATALTLIAYVVSQVLLRRYPIVWITQDGQRIRIASLGLWPTLVLVGVLAALWIPMAFGVDDISSPTVPEPIPTSRTASSPHRQSRLKLISIVPEAGTGLVYEDLLQGVPVSAVVEYATPQKTEQSEVIPVLAMYTLRQRKDDGKASWDRVSIKAANQEISRVSIQGVLHDEAIYRSLVTVMLSLEFYDAETEASRSVYEAIVLIEFPVTGAPSIDQTTVPEAQQELTASGDTIGCLITPTLISPTNGAKLDTLLPRLRARYGDNASASGLIMEMSPDINFSKEVHGFEVNQSGRRYVDDYIEYRPLHNLEPSSTYYWRAAFVCNT